MAIFNSCCCCELRIGIIVLAALGILGSCCNFYSIVTLIDYAEERDHNYTFLKNSMKFGLAFEVFDLLFCIMLLVCAILHRPKYKIMALIWVIGACIMCFILFVFAIVVCVVAKGNVTVILITLASFVAIILIVALLTLVVYSYYQQLRDTQPEFITLLNQEKDNPSAYSETHSERVVVTISQS